MKAILVILLAFSLVSVGVGYNLPASSIRGNLNMTSHNVIGLAAPTNDTDAATKAYADSVAIGGGLPTTGGTMTGQIDFGAIPGYNIGEPVNDSDVSSKSYVDNASSVVVGYIGSNNSSAFDYVDSSVGWLNIENYGGVHDGITNDTAAFNAVVTAANDGCDWSGDDNRLYSHSNNTVYLPAGNYNLTLNSTVDVRCSIYGPDATLQAHDASSGTLLRLNNSAFNSVCLKGLHGWRLPLTTAQATGYLQSGSYIGTGLEMKGQCVYDNIQIGQIAGFQFGQFIGDWYSPSHIASCNIFTNVLQHNTFNRYIYANFYAVEDNQFTELYNVGANITGYYKAPNNNTGLVTDNRFNPGVVESFTGATQGFVLVGENATGNIYDFTRIMPTGGYDLVHVVDGDSGLPTDNTYTLHDANSVPTISIGGDGNRLDYEEGRGNYVYCTSSAATTIKGADGTQIPFATEVSDLLDQWDGQTFTAKSSGMYQINGFITISAFAQSYPQAFYGYIEVNDVPKFTTIAYETNATAGLSLSYASNAYLDVGDRIEFLTWKSSSGDVAMSGNVQYNWMTITQV